MAQAPETAKSYKSPFSISALAQTRILALGKAMLDNQKRFLELKTKMEHIDIAYARYKGAKTDKERKEAGETACGDVFLKDELVAPVVVSQVDSMVAYLAEVFLSGYPLFPVVSPPHKRQNAEKLEVLLDDHAMLDGYIRQLLLMLVDGQKYNVAAIETHWDSIDQFSVVADYTETQGRKIDTESKSLTKIRRIDPYNLVWDYSVSPGDVAKEGDYAGYIELITKTKLKRYLHKLNKADRSTSLRANHVKALNSKFFANNTSVTPYYTFPPTVSNYVQGDRKGANWGDWLGMTTPLDGKKTNMYDGSMFEKFTFYARVLPSDLDIAAPAENTPQIFRFVIINNEIVVEADRIISAYDYLPILMSQPKEDGLSYQTQSLAEGAAPFQEAATTLYNIRFQAARRAVSDRALYNADLINPTDVNNPAAAAKIPVRLKALSPQGLESAYRQIPFDMRGTETTLSDARTIVSFSEQLSGLNGPQQGQFQRGNKSLAEWNDTQAGSENRLRMQALTLEVQVFTPLKQILALNIFQYGDNAQVVSQRSGDVIDVNIDELRKEVHHATELNESANETLGCVLLAIRQNEYLQTYYPEQNGFKSGKYISTHPSKLLRKEKYVE